MTPILAGWLGLAPMTVLQFQPGADNPAFPGVASLVGLVLVGVGGLTTAFAVLWLSDATSERNGRYPDESDGTDDGRLSPTTLGATGIVLLVAGLYVLFALG